jgi:hypothetical protein
MIRVTWLQHKREALIAGFVLAIVAVALIIIRSVVNSVVTQAMHSCPAGSNGGFCSLGSGEFMALTSVPILAKYVVLALPALLAVFVAAPLVAREVEQGTHTLAWTQSITRIRWFAVKAVVLGVASVTAAVALSVLMGWWHQPLDVLFGNGSWTFFDTFGPAPIAYAVFALALGLTASVLIRRVVPAMAATLFVFAAVRTAITYLRPSFMPPVVKADDLGKIGLPAGSLQVNLYWTDASQHRLSAAEFQSATQQICPGSVGAAGSSGATPIDSSGLQCLADHGYRVFSVYQPAERLGTFQAIEAGIFLLLAAALMSVCVWWLQRRVH